MTCLQEYAIFGIILVYRRSAVATTLKSSFSPKYRFAKMELHFVFVTFMAFVSLTQFATRNFLSLNILPYTVSISIIIQTPALIRRLWQPKHGNDEDEESCLVYLFKPLAKIEDVQNGLSAAAETICLCTQFDLEMVSKYNQQKPSHSYALHNVFES